MYIPGFVTYIYRVISHVVTDVVVLSVTYIYTVISHVVMDAVPLRRLGPHYVLLVRAQIRGLQVVFRVRVRVRV